MSRRAEPGTGLTTVAVLPELQVVAAVLRDASGRVLICERPPGKSMAGWWEFPGGKIADGESPAAALARELREELGIGARVGRLLLRLSHDYPDRRVQLAVHVIDGYTGEVSGLEGQRIKWVPAGRLGDERLLPADLPIVRALTQG